MRLGVSTSSEDWGESLKRTLGKVPQVSLREEHATFHVFHDEFVLGR